MIVSRKKAAVKYVQAPRPESMAWWKTTAPPPKKKNEDKEGKRKNGVRFYIFSSSFDIDDLLGNCVFLKKRLRDMIERYLRGNFISHNVTEPLNRSPRFEHAFQKTLSWWCQEHKYLSSPAVLLEMTPSNAAPVKTIFFSAWKVLSYWSDIISWTNIKAKIGWKGYRDLDGKEVDDSMVRG